MMKRYTRRRVLGAGSALLVGALLAACGEEDEGTDAPSGSDGASTEDPTQPPAATPTQTQAPTQPPAATTTPTTPAIEFPTEADAAVLKIEIEGGLTSPEEILRRVPTIAIYGDGSVYTLGPQIEIYPPPAEVPLQVAKISAAGIQMMLAEAEKADLLGEDAHYPLDGVTDLATTVISITANGKTTKTSIYGLYFDGTGVEIPDDLREGRERVSDAVDKVLSYQSWLPAEDIVAETTEATIERLQIVTFPYPYDTGDTQEIQPGEIDWPLTTSPLEIGEEFFFPGTDGARAAMLEGEDLATMQAAIKQSNTLTQWMADGDPYRLINIPLLPDETEIKNPFDSGQGPQQGSYTYPTEPGALVMRYELTGGFVPQESLIDYMPSFSLYGDGLVVTQGVQIAIYPPPAMPALVFSYLTPEGIETILAEADAAGLLMGEQDWPATGSNIADAQTGVLTINSGGAPSRISVYAPGMEDQMNDISPEERAFREQFNGFVVKLNDLLGWLPAEAFEDRGGDYPLDRMQIVLQPSEFAPAPQPGIEPGEKDLLLDPLPEGTELPTVEQSQCYVLEAEDAATMREQLADATRITRWKVGEGTFILHARPLLPDEIGCDSGSR